MTLPGHRPDSNLKSLADCAKPETYSLRYVTHVLSIISERFFFVRCTGCMEQYATVASTYL